MAKRLLAAASPAAGWAAVSAAETLRPEETADLVPVDLTSVDLAPVDLAPVGLAPLDLAPVDLTSGLAG
jgi:hypothetical protein